MESNEESVSSLERMIVLTNWFPKLVETQVDFIATTLTSILSTTFKPSQQLVDHDHFKNSHNHDHGTTTNNNNTSTVVLDDSAETQTQTQTHNQTRKLVRKVGYGLIGAVYVGVVLALVMMLAVVAGVVMVNYFTEQPLLVKQRLYFDYTDVNPQAVFVFGDSNSNGGVPVGHTFHVCVVLLVPDSDYNRDIGNFQLTAEVMSTNGKLIARSSQPLMLQFHSYPIRLVRTFIRAVPLLLGISRETQNIKVQMIRYKEDNIVRTDAVKITLMPRAWTPYLPQIYEAEIQLHSKLPWMKELVHNWKWTFYVWTSLYVYALLLTLLLCFFRTLLVFPMILKTSERHEGREQRPFEREERPEVRVPEGREVSETLRKWQQYRRKRKAALLMSRSAFTETNMDSTSASSYTVSKDPDIFSTTEEDVGDSESVCEGGYDDVAKLVG